jgi:integrase/recombinase XerD
MIENLQTLSEKYLEGLAVQGYSPRTCDSKRWLLNYFIVYCSERDIEQAEQVTKVLALRYQKHVYLTKKEDGSPLLISTQRSRMNEIKLWFRWLAKAGFLPFSCLEEIALPKLPKQLPKAILNVEEVEKLMAQPDLSTAVGLRDRAMMEVLYSTAIRRRELIQLQQNDVDIERGWLMVRLGKGAKDRVVPIGERAIFWLERYLKDARPELMKLISEQALFISGRGLRLHHTTLGCSMLRYKQASGITKSGSCHAFRHTTATLMLENGADIRHIQAMLGHECLSTTQIYTQVAIKHLKEVHQKTHPGEQLS